MSPIRHFLSALKFRQTSDGNDVLSPHAFQVVLNTERARSDRSGWPFTLVVLKVVDPDLGDSTTSATLVEVVEERTRRIDYKGWYKGNLAVILPYTDTESATELLKDIEERYAKRVRKSAGVIGAFPELEFMVYCYPPGVDRKVETV